MKSDLRGVASWGLEQISARVPWEAMQGRLALPLIDMQVGRHVGGQACGGRGTSHWLQGEVVGARLFHAEVAEVEVLGPQGVGSKQWLRRGEISAVAPGAWQRRRMHGGEGRRHLHGCSMAEEVWTERKGCPGRGGRRVAVQKRASVGTLFSSLGNEAGRGHLISMQDEKANSNPVKMGASKMGRSGAE